MAGGDDLLAGFGEAQRPLHDTLIVSFSSWEGPLDLLLDLARTRKIDLAAIPILSLVDQYLAFIAEARQLRLEIAADYLVMAAWLAYLKSALLLPKEERPDPDPEIIAEQLRWRLRRLEAMRDAADHLLRRDVLGRDVLMRGRPEGLRAVHRSAYVCSLHDLLAAYAGLQARAETSTWTPHDRGAICTLEDALDHLADRLGRMVDWQVLPDVLPPTADRDLGRSWLASGFVAALELTRLGKAELQQKAAFAPVRIRRRVS